MDLCVRGKSIDVIIIEYTYEYLNEDRNCIQALETKEIPLLHGVAVWRHAFDIVMISQYYEKGVVY